MMKTNRKILRNRSDLRIIVFLMDKNSHKTVMLPNNEVTQALRQKHALILVDDSKNISAT